MESFPSKLGLAGQNNNNLEPILHIRFSIVLHVRHIYIYLLFIYLKIRTMYRGENNRTRSPLLGSPSYSDPIKCRKTNPLPQKTRIKY